MEQSVHRRATVTAEGPKIPPATEAWHATEQEFLATGNSSRVQRALTRVRDELAAEAFRAVIEPAFPQTVAMLASGAYGLGYAFPYSELEILLLVDAAKQPESLKELLPDFVRRLWDAGLLVNSTVLPIAACLGAFERGNPLGPSLLGRRFLAGDGAVHEKFEGRLPAVMASHAQEMSQYLCQAGHARHSRYRNTPRHAAPDVCGGPGGSEDLFLLDRLASLRTEQDERSDEFSRAAVFVSSARCFLHYRAGADQNVFDAEAQQSLDRQAFTGGKSSSDWMRQYFYSACTIFSEARRAIERAEKSRSSLLENFREYRSRLSNQEFTVSRERLLLRNPAQLATDPSLVFRILEFVARHGVAPAAETERRLEGARAAFAEYCTQSLPLWPTIKTTLSCPHAAMALRTLEATGLMRGLFPEWASIEYLVTTDPDFRYTVDEHTLQTIEQVLELPSATTPERKRFAELLSEIDDVAVLLFGLLFREMGRGGADPLQLAVERLFAATARLQMPQDAQSTVEFLIRHQFDVSEATSGRDVEDPATARFLAERVETIERLKLLTVMTYGRIVALGDEAKIPWRLEQLWRAYSVAEYELTRELETDRIQQTPENLPANAEFLKGLPLRYLRSHSPGEIEGHLRLFELSRPTGVAVRLDSIEGAYRLTVVARDKPFLFASFAGAISSFGLDILKAEAFSNAQGSILDTFVFADPKRMLQQNPSEADRLHDLIQRIALGKTDAQRLMRGCRLPEAVKGGTPPQVQFDSEACPTATLVEIQTEDRPGLLYCLATVFSSSACNIDVVLVDTKGHRAIDVFYVAQDGRKLSADVQTRLKERLLAVC